MKPPESVGNKMQPRAVSFIFSRRRMPSVSFCFPTDLWRFHNFMPLKIMKPSASFFFDAKKIWNQYRQFHPVFAWNWSTIKIKNKDGFFWNLLFFIKQVNKSRVGFKKKWKFFGFKKKVKVFLRFHFCKKKYIFFLIMGPNALKWLLKKDKFWEFKKSLFTKSFVNFSNFTPLIGFCPYRISNF